MLQIQATLWCAFQVPMLVHTPPSRQKSTTATRRESTTYYFSGIEESIRRTLQFTKYYSQNMSNISRYQKVSEWTVENPRQCPLAPRPISSTRRTWRDPGGWGVHARDRTRRSRWRKARRTSHEETIKTPTISAYIFSRCAAENSATPRTRAAVLQSVEGITFHTLRDTCST